MTPPSVGEDNYDSQLCFEGLSEEDDLLQPLVFACATQLARVDADMYPLFASLEVMGLPMTSLLAGTPEAMIWRRAVCGQVEDEDVMRPEQVVYSVEPSVAHVSQTTGNVGLWRSAHDCRTARYTVWIKSHERVP